MKIHLIAIGGSIMHNLAITLQKAGHLVSGSDDEIYEPARSRLEKYGLLPDTMGWNDRRITDDIDLIVLGMHARKDNPELVQAQALGLRILSFPAFVAEQSRDKTRVVVAGSHGKTSTTSMIMHVLQHAGIQYDYLVGAQLDGFETMVQLSDAPLIIIEGDEYLSSPLDRVPKIWHYQPHMSIITGIAWDHMNVFPTFESYLDAFAVFLQRQASDSTVYYFEDDAWLQKLAADYGDAVHMVPYTRFEHRVKDGRNYLMHEGQEVATSVFGQHNMENLRAAWHVCRELGVTDAHFMEAASTFKGAAKRLQIKRSTQRHITWQDFAHAPSKVRATTRAAKSLYPNRALTACVELHTFSSLNAEFLPQYAGALEAADEAVVYFDKHTLRMKKMPDLGKEEVKSAFKRDDLEIFDNSEELSSYLKSKQWDDHNLLMMSSGRFGGIDLTTITT